MGGEADIPAAGRFNSYCAHDKNPMPKDPLSTFANTPAEVHSIAHGLHDGYFQKSPGEVPDGIEDVRREQPYYKASYLLAYLVSKHLSRWDQ